MENETLTIADEASISWPDWMVIGIMLGASAGIGIYYRFSGGQQKTAEEYFSADRSVGNVMLSFTMMIAYLSAIALLGSSGENYSYGAQFNVIYVGLLLGTPIVSYCYLPVFYELKMMSVYEYLQRRFGVATRLVACTACFILINLYTGVVIYAPALALEATTGLDGTTSILLIGFICTFYSSIGGIKAVIITDVLQGALMLICVYSVIGVALADIDGGIWTVIERAQKGGRFNLDFDLDPTVRHTWWSLSIGGIVFYLSLFGCGQVEMQRMLTAKTIGDARRALWMNIPMTLIMALTISFSGLVLYAYYFHCDPVTAGKIKSYDMVMPHFAKDRMTQYPGLTGIFIAGVFSASLSTVSAMLNSLAAIALADYIKPLYNRFGHEFPENKVVFYGRTLGIIMGLVTMSIAFLARTLGSLIQAVLGIHGAIGGPILGLFTLGMFTESANEVGAITGLLLSTICSLILIFSPKPFTPRLPMSIDHCPNSTQIYQTPIQKIYDPSSYFYLNRLSYLWITPLGMITSFIVGYIVSLIFRKCSKIPPPILDTNLFTPLLAARIKRRRENEPKNSQIFILDTIRELPS
ncbi:hypothetical protein PV325_006866 [Microctonus aethiopoides]|nr:hypothetical protein PV325_006866 [Microctonus aethiopoides]